jgi:MYXO-CTERM domain-containing protein
MTNTRLSLATCVAVVALLCGLSARANFSGYFAVPAGGPYPADPPVALGNWIFDASGSPANGPEGLLTRIGIFDATQVNLFTQDGPDADTTAWADFYIANGSGLPYGIGFSWSTSYFDNPGDRASYYLNGVETVLATGPLSGTATYGDVVSGVVLNPGDTFSWRITAHSGDPDGESLSVSLDTPVLVPEPSAALLALLGLAASGLIRRRRA